jgi:membrane protease subunit HflC
MNKTMKTLLVIGSIIAVLIIVRPFFVLEEGQQAVVIRFGKITRVETDAGLKFKTPFVDGVVFYPEKIFSWDGEPRQVPTSEQLYVWVDSTARWKITDPALFYQSLKTVNQAQGKLDDIIESTLKTVIAQYPLIESVRSSNTILGDEPTDTEIENGNVVEDTAISLLAANNNEAIDLGRSVLSGMMLELAAPNVERFGMELIDIVIRQIKFNDELTQSVHERMIQERRQIAANNRADGKGVREELLGQLSKDKDIVLSNAKADAEEIMGEADAVAAAMYAEAYSKDPEFYRFWKAMDSYKQTLPALDKVLTTDMEYFDYLYNR